MCESVRESNLDRKMHARYASSSYRNMYMYSHLHRHAYFEHRYFNYNQIMVLTVVKQMHFLPASRHQISCNTSSVCISATHILVKKCWIFN